MKLYTKGGDRGETALFGGQRVPKNNLRVCAYGTVDEANSFIGVVASCPSLPDDIGRHLPGLMSDLFDLGAELATPTNESAQALLERRLTSRVTAERITEIEVLIDEADGACPQMKSFVLPTGTPAAAHLHVARSVVRRAERDVMALVVQGEFVDDPVLVMLNRVSDLLFAWARWANVLGGVDDVPWQAKKS
ncbi:MAG: cob(I)yrinic acid a,c-diamide adenosyltransferase [Deltaproteobacteria bacterium]|nr:cob(I)yrinic acid a,c-diamide adenosyltransferase [Deltaproteobacteria bacterium]